MESVEILRDGVNLSKVSTDLMIGLPHQTMDSFMDTLVRAEAMGFGHISLYILCSKLSKNRIISWASWERVKHNNYVLIFCIKMAWFVPIGYRVNKSKKTSFILHPFTLFFRLLNWYNTFISGMKSLSQTTT